MTVEQVSERIFRVPSTLGVRRFAQWLVVGDDGILLVDSGIDGTIAEHVAPALAHLGHAPDRLTEVVISHADVDHYGGNAELRAVAPRARIRAHPVDRRQFERWDVIGHERYGWYRGHGLDYDDATWDWLRSAAGPDTPIDGDIAGGDTIDLGGIAVEIVELPGHSAGHLGVVHRESGVAIVMDSVLARGLYTVDGELISPPPYATVAGYRTTVARLRELAPTNLGTSHYAPIEGRAAVSEFLDATESFIDDLDALVRGRLSSSPQPLRAFWEPAAAELGPFREMSVELARSVAAHLDEAVAAGVAEESEVDGLPAWSST